MDMILAAHTLGSTGSSLHDAGVAILLFAGVAVELMCCVGVLVMRTPLQRLHYVGPAATVGPALIAAAVALSQYPFWGASLKADFIALVLIVFGPVLTHATARAIMTSADGNARIANMRETS